MRRYIFYQISQPTYFISKNFQVLSIVVAGSSVVNVNVAKSLIVEFQSNAIDLTPDELYDSDLLINYLAALLGISQSQIKIVDVVPEGGSRRRRGLDYTYGSARSRRNALSNDIVIEILPEDPNTEDPTSYVTSEGASKTTVIKEMASTIVSAIINDEIPQEMNLDPIVTTTVVVEPTVPECYVDEAANLANDANYVAGDGCSLAAQLGVEPDDLSTVIDTSKARFKIILN